MTEVLVAQEEFSIGLRKVGDTLQNVIRIPDRLALIGIHTHGVPLARRLKKRLDEAFGGDSPVGDLDITLYRDDYDLRGIKPRIQSSKIPFSIDDRELVLVDDVLYTGRTIRAAIEALGDYGRPRSIRLAVLADRGHRELPIQADAVGFQFETKHDDRIRVKTTEIDGVDEIVLIPKGYVL